MNTTTTPEAIADNRIIALDKLTPSKTNPRKRFDDARLAELAASIKQQGILQPLLVRELHIFADAATAAGKAATNWPFLEKTQSAAGEFEIIAGERRYRAAKLAGLADVPCFVRNLTDLQVLHAQVIENLQRDDLHPLEEAEGYEKLMKEHGATAESLAGEIGKSKAYIYARLKLCALAPEAREAFYAGELDASTALLIARIPVGKLQVQAIKAITKRVEYSTSNMKEGDIAMSYRTARDYIQREFMLDLDRAPFDTKDTALLPKAGACTDCDKRTGNQPDIFDDGSCKDVCTDTVCHALKKTAHILAIQKAAEENGDKVILGKEAKKIIPYAYNQNSQLESAGLAELDQKIPGDANDRTWEEALKQTGKPFVQKTIVQNPHSGSMVTTINIEDAMKALRQAGFEIKPIHSAKNEQNDAAAQKEREKAKAKLEQAKAYRQHLFTALHQKIEADMQASPPHVADGLYRIIAEAMFEQISDHGGAIVLAKTFIPDLNDDDDDAVERIEAMIPTMTTQQHFLLMINILTANDLSVGHWNSDKQPATMIAVAKEIGVDAEAIEKQAIAEIKAAILAAKKEKKTPPTPSPAAQAQDLGAVAEAGAAAPKTKEKAKSKAKMKAAAAA
jgi:ParB/RepB/Spo0J family partition protein